MKIAGVGTNNIFANDSSPDLPKQLSGILAFAKDGQLVLKTEVGEFPARFIGIEPPPVGQELFFRVAGREGNSLILNVIALPQEADGWEVFIRESGLDASVPWRELIAALCREGMPIGKDNLTALARNLRSVAQEWGVVLRPRVIAFLLARGLPIRPDTVLAALYRLYPGTRRKIAEALFGHKPVKLEIGNARETEMALREALSQPQAEADNCPAWQAAFGSVVYITADDGEIHWPSGKEAKEDHPSGKRFRFEVIPPHIGLVEVVMNQFGEGCRIDFTVDPQYLRLFEDEIPRWQEELRERGMNIVASVKAAEADGSPLPPRIDARV